jgi:hypothetical protein
MHPRHVKTRSYVMNEGDLALIEYISSFLGCSKADSVRSAIRAFAGQLAQIEKRGRQT